ncbi:glycosyltransferase 87 family protein [Streptomyces sp. NPDC055709]
MRRFPGGRRALWITGWLGAAGWAAVLAAVSALPMHRVWGLCAAVGYLGAALLACLLPRPRARALSVGSALTGAVAVPFVHLLATGRAQSEVGVIERSAATLLHSGTPYLTDPRVVTDYNPYLPGMALFGIPARLFGDGSAPARLAGDPRLWCAVVLLVCLLAGRAVLRRGGGTPGGAVDAPTRTASAAATAVLVASPPVALPLCVSGVDLPLTGLLALALALAARHRPVPAALVLAAACSLKWTALPAVAVVVALLAGGSGPRAAARCAAVWAAGTAALVLPAVLAAPGPLVEQVFLFPTGRADLPTPAASPLPGRLLADLGPAGWYAAVLLLVCGGSAVAVSLALRPPAGVVAAADRLAVGLCVAFLFAPAGRFGYFALPLLLAVWARLATGPSRARPSSSVRPTSTARPIFSVRPRVSSAAVPASVAAVAGARPVSLRGRR